MSRASLLVVEIQRCYLSRLVVLAGQKLPAGVTVRPDAATVPHGQLPDLIDRYTTFLRSPKSLP